MDHLDPTHDLRSRYAVCRLGLSLVAVACAIMAIDSAGWVGLMFIRNTFFMKVFNSPSWIWVAGSTLTWSAFLGSLLLIGRWKEPHWRRNATLLALTSGLGVLLWFLRHADRFGLGPGEAPFVQLRMHLTIGLRWVWMFLVVDMATEVSEHLGSASVVKERAAARTALAVACIFWILLLLPELPHLLDPQAGRRRGFGFRGPFLPLQFLGFTLARCVASFLITITALTAARECSVILKELRADENNKEYLDW